MLVRIFNAGDVGGVIVRSVARWRVMPLLVKRSGHYSLIAGGLLVGGALCRCS